MNEILRFKKGRMIPKAEDGIKTERRTPGGQIIYETEDRGEGFFTKLGRWLTTPLTTGTTPGGQSYFTETSQRPVDTSTSTTRTLGAPTNSRAAMEATYYSQNAAAKEHLTMDLMRAKHYGSLENYRKALGSQPAAIVRRTGGTRPNYASNFARMNFTDEEKKYMMDAGFDPTNAKSVQEFILSKASNANLGARKGAGIADGYWGDKSASAFQALRNQGIFTPKVDAQEAVKPVSETPIDSPDFGYKSDGNYSADQADTLKANGIRDWSSLINYAGRNKNSDFTRLLSGYFGTNDITQWDRNKLEGDAKIHGNYHGQDRSQLQGFLGGLQARNNQQYYDKVAAYAKQNPTPTTPRFDFSKISKLEVPEFKFNLSNVGASTLGGNMGLI